MMAAATHPGALRAAAVAARLCGGVQLRPAMPERGGGEPMRNPGCLILAVSILVAPATARMILLRAR